MCKLYLVDDDQDVLDSLGWMLDALDKPTESFLSATAFLDAIDLRQPAIAMLDIQMPQMDGIELLDNIKTAGSPMSIIMLTGHGTISMAVQCIQKGAIDFLEKPVDGDKLVILLEKAKQATLASFNEQSQRDNVSNLIATLTKREHEVMLKVLEGKLNKVIANELNIAQRTIELHRQRVMQKMHVSNIAELAFLLAKTPTE
ncbi:response regulator [Shewanella sp. ULN5]|uniref:response regulator transcription factor n=1 Tax=Shewanella sp. ULN5 TaxID=2994678 RepID=UPI00273EB408|nr:response regulator [Shewanella sp. ULN5]MDP5148289.1 response regulator [Shewanella sp. ULN5]